MTLYPKLNKKLGLIGAICLIVWGLFILGMQLYVFGYYSQVYGEGTAGDGWADAYNGMALANSAACLLLGLFYIVAFTDQPTTQMLLWAMILAVMGAGAAVASTVLTALQSDWLNTSVNTDSDHPCILATESETEPLVPTELVCTNWFALEVTVSVLSGLAFGEYIFIGVVIFVGLSGGKHSDAGHGPPKPAHSPPNAVHPLQPPVVRINNHPPSARGLDGPYSAYHPPSAGPAAAAATVGDGHSLDELNPQFSYHLQQLSLQQMAQHPSTADSSPKASPAMHASPHGPPTPAHRQPPAVPLNHQVNRGRLQVLHNQRQRAPAPPVPFKPPANNSSLYRY